MPVTSRDRVAWIALAVTLAVGAILRLQDVNSGRLDFHATRQYRSAIIARACYYEHADVPEWAQRVAIANRGVQPAAEPPLLEWLACASYRVLGDERLAIPRTLSALFWMVGAIPLYRLARRMASVEATTIGVAVYVFQPYAIVASRSFQPDPLMTCCSLWAILACVRCYERPDRARMLIGALAIAVAAFVKPMSVFITLPAIAGLAIGHGALTSGITWALPVLGLLPAVVHYGHATLFGTLAKDQMMLRFVPALVGTSFFWSGLWTQIERVFGWPIFMAGVAGALVAPPAFRAMLIALWAGYGVFAVAFTYHMPTHDYYHLPYVAVVSLGIAALLARVTSAHPGRGRFTTGALVAVMVTIAAWGSIVAWPRLRASGGHRVARYEAIGALVQHDTRVLFLDPEYGYPLMYHGQVSGDAWPNVDDLTAESLGGRRPLDAHARFARDYATLRPAYFVVTDLGSLAAQPDLQRLLDDMAVLVDATPTDRVYRFRPRNGRP